MPLESLLALVHELRARIDTHGDALRQSEALTRYALIDPLLRELGWDTTDPSSVVPEYRSQRGSADYALLNESRPAIMVEAKKLGTRLRDADPIVQVLNYRTLDGIEHFSLTDGQRWDVYKTRRRGDIDEKRIVSFDLKEQPTAEVCLQSLALWRPAVEAGHVAAPKASIVAPDEAEAQQGTAVEPQPSPSYPDGAAWKSMADWKPGQGDPTPVEIMFPDGSRTKIRYAYNVAVESTLWLVKGNHLTRTHCPITQDKRGKRNLVVDDLNLLQYRGANNYKRVGDLYIDVKYNGHIHARNASTIIEHVGQDPARFQVRFD